MVTTQKRMRVKWEKTKMQTDLYYSITAMLQQYLAGLKTKSDHLTHDQLNMNNGKIFGNVLL